MHYLIFFVLASISVAAYGRFHGPGVYAASLGGAPVGLYGKTSRGGKEVYGASLGGAQVGIYGKETGRYYDYYSPSKQVHPRWIIPALKVGAAVLPHVVKWVRGRHHVPAGHGSVRVPHASLSASGSFGDSFHHKTGAGTYSYEGNYNPLEYFYQVAKPVIPTYFG